LLFRGCVKTAGLAWWRLWNMLRSRGRARGTGRMRSHSRVVRLLRKEYLRLSQECIRIYI
jgi:hypothetical protein